MKLPKKIKVAGRTLDVVLKRAAELQGNIGTFSNWLGEISIANEEDIDPDQKGVTLLHEIIECINLRFEYDMPHPVIQGLAENLYQVLKDNKLYFGDN